MFRFIPPHSVLFRSVSFCAVSFRSVPFHVLRFMFVYMLVLLPHRRRPEEEVLGLLELMRGEGLLPDSYTYVGVIKALVGRDRCERGRELLEDAKTHLEGEALSAVYGAVISGCSPLAR